MRAPQYVAAELKDLPPMFSARSHKGPGTTVLDGYVIIFVLLSMFCAFILIPTSLACFWVLPHHADRFLYLDCSCSAVFVMCMHSHTPAIPSSRSSHRPASCLQTDHLCENQCPCGRWILNVKEALNRLGSRTKKRSAEPLPPSIQIFYFLRGVESRIRIADTKLRSPASDQNDCKECYHLHEAGTFATYIYVVLHEVCLKVVDTNSTILFLGMTITHLRCRLHKSGMTATFICFIHAFVPEGWAHHFGHFLHETRMTMTLNLLWHS